MTEGWKCPVCNLGVAASEKHCDHGWQQQFMNPLQSRTVELRDVVVVPSPLKVEPIEMCSELTKRNADIV